MNKPVAQYTSFYSLLNYINTFLILLLVVWKVWSKNLFGFSFPLSYTGSKQFIRSILHRCIKLTLRSVHRPFLVTESLQDCINFKSCQILATTVLVYDAKAIDRRYNTGRKYSRTTKNWNEKNKQPEQNKKPLPNRKDLVGKAAAHFSFLRQQYITSLRNENRSEYKSFQATMRLAQF